MTTEPVFGKTVFGVSGGDAAQPVMVSARCGVIVSRNTCSR